MGGSGSIRRGIVRWVSAVTEGGAESRPVRPLLSKARSTDHPVINNEPTTSSTGHHVDTAMANQTLSTAAVR
jgi:hypothetical protein